mgnify:CR=1 FL=1
MSAQRRERSATFSALARIEPVFENANAIDLDTHDIASLEIFRRGEANSDACRRASCDDVADIEGDAPAERFYQRGNVENQLRDLGVLARFRRKLLGKVIAT